jgi:hypothetical protein
MSDQSSTAQVANGKDVSSPRPITRLLRLTKSGERVPVTLRIYSYRNDIQARLSIPPVRSVVTHLYGIEYDDAGRGRHEGVYEGAQVFQCRQKGVGAGTFLLSSKDLYRGYTFAEALAERYDGEIPGSDDGSGWQRADAGRDMVRGALKLGTTGIVVEAPGLDGVQSRLKQLRRLQSVGLEEYAICERGGSDETREFLSQHLTGKLQRERGASRRPQVLIRQRLPRLTSPTIS